MRDSFPHRRGGVVYDVLGEFIPEAQFVEELKSLAHAEHELLTDVCIRVRLADWLRYELPISFEREKIGILFSIDPLEIYLLCTCIDALAGQHRVELQGWLRAGPKKAYAQHRDRVARSALDKWAASDSCIDLTGFLRAMEQVVSEHRREHGHGTNFRRFFQDLPPVLRSTLAGSYRIYKGDEPKIPRSPEEDAWAQLSESEKLQRIADYLYHYRRNIFTHRAKTAPTFHSSQLDKVTSFDVDHLIERETRWSLRIFGRRKDEEWISCKGNEAELLRETVVATSRKLLGDEVDELYLTRHRRIRYQVRLLHLVRQETRYNRSVFAFYDSEVNRTEYLPDYLPAFSTELLKRAREDENLDLTSFLVIHREVMRDIDEVIKIAQRLNAVILPYNESLLRSRRKHTDFDLRKEDIFDALRADHGYWLLPHLLNDVYRECSRAVNTVPR